MMFAEWVTTGVGWGIMIASAAFTIFVIAGFIIGLLSMLAYFLRGDQGEEKDTEDNFKHPRRPV